MGAEGRPEPSRNDFPGQSLPDYMDSDSIPVVDTLQQALNEGAVLVRRAANGWIMESASPDGPDPKWIEVFQDPSGCPFCQSLSLAQLLMSGFDPWMQTEEHGGLSVMLFEEPSEPE